LSDVQARALAKKNKDQIDILSGINNFAVIPTYTNGQLTKVEEKSGNNVIQSSAITYNTDGSINTVSEIINGKTVVTTLNYSNGEFSHITKEVI